MEFDSLLRYEVAGDKVILSLVQKQGFLSFTLLFRMGASRLEQTSLL